MHKKNTIIRITVGICLILFLLTLPWLKLRKSYVVIESSVDAAMTEEGEFRIVDKGGARVLFTDPSLRVQRIFESEDEIKQIVVTGTGKTYIRTFREIEQNGCVKREAIYLLDKKGRNSRLVYELVHEQAKPMPDMFQISGLGEKLRIAIRDEDGFGIYELEESGDLRELVYIPHEDANLWVYRAVLSSDSRTAYYCFHDGTIYSYDVKRKTEEKIYDGSSFQQPESIPKELTLSRDGTFYFADIGFRDIGSIKEGQTSFLFGHRELDKEEFLQQESFEAINAEQELLGCSRYGVYFPIGGELTSVSKLELSMIATIGAMVSKISLSVICLAVLYYILRLVRVFFQKAVLMVKIIFALSVSLGIIGALLVIIILPDYEALMMKELENRTRDVGYLVAQQIPTDHLQNLNSIADYRKTDYMEIKEVIDHIFFSRNGVNDLYCVLYTIRDDVITVNYSSGEDCGCVYPYDWQFEGSDEQEIMETGMAKSYSKRDSFEGSYSFSLSPIFDQDGKVVGLAEVGVYARQFEEGMDKVMGELLTSIMVIAAATIFLIVQLFRLAEYQGNKDD